MKSTLRKNERLKSRKAIESLFKNGIALKAFPYRVVYILASFADENPRLQAGFSASSRKFKKAVDRNRIKRITREAYRIHKRGLQRALESSNKKMQVFFIYTGGELPAFSVANEKLAGIMNKLIHIVDEKTTQDT